MGMIGGFSHGLVGLNTWPPGSGAVLGVGPSWKRWLLGRQALRIIPQPYFHLGSLPPALAEM